VADAGQPDSRLAPRGDAAIQDARLRRLPDGVARRERGVAAWEARPSPGARACRPLRSPPQRGGQSSTAPPASRRASGGRSGCGRGRGRARPTGSRSACRQSRFPSRSSAHRHASVGPFSRAAWLSGCCVRGELFFTRGSEGRATDPGDRRRDSSLCSISSASFPVLVSRSSAAEVAPAHARDPQHPRSSARRNPPRGRRRSPPAAPHGPSEHRLLPVAPGPARSCQQAWQVKH
jgi:hypothetical protein